MSQSSDFDPALHIERTEDDSEPVKPAARKEAEGDIDKPAGREEDTDIDKPAGRLEHP